MYENKEDTISKDDALWLVRRWIHENHGNQKNAAGFFGIKTRELSQILNGQKPLIEPIMREVGLLRHERYTVIKKINLPSFCNINNPIPLHPVSDKK